MPTDTNAAYTNLGVAQSACRKALAVASNPVAAEEHIQAAIAACFEAIASLVDPAQPANFKAVQHVATGAAKLDDAIAWLDPDSGKDLDDVIGAIARANSAIAKAGGFLPK